VRIVDCTPTPGSNLYSVVCYNGHPFNTAGDNRGRVKCPKCKREGDLREMVKVWKATPAENLQRLREIYAEARKLYTQYEALPEIDRGNTESKAMEAKLDEYYKAAKVIISTVAAAG